LGTARSRWAEFVQRHREVPEGRSAFADTLTAIAVLKLKKKEFAAARDLIAEALPQNAAALSTKARHPQSRRVQRDALLVKARARVFETPLVSRNATWARCAAAPTSRGSLLS